MIDPHFYTLRTAMTLAELASELGVALPVPEAGDELIEIPSSLNDSLPGSITFFSDKRRKGQLNAAQATACLTTQTLEPLVAKTGMIALVADNPRAMFARLSAKMVTIGSTERSVKGIHKTAEIHPSATIGKDVTIGAGSRIGANSVLDDGVIIGEYCNIEPLVRLSFTKMGDGCYIKSGTIIGGTGFGVVEDSQGIFVIPHLGRVVIHNNVQIGSNCCIDKGQLGDTEIYDDVKIDNLVQIAHNVRIGEGTMIAGHAGIAGSTVIGKKCLLGGRASLSDHVTLGDGTIIAAFAGVMSDLEGGQMYSGAPAMPIREHMRTVAYLRKLAAKK